MPRPFPTHQLLAVILSHCHSLGPVRVARLFERYGSLEAVWKAPREELMTIEGISVAVMDEFFQVKEQFDPAPTLERMEREGISVVTWEDEEYPSLLRELYDPPFILYYRGILPKDYYGIAVVGSRKMSEYGLKAVQHIVSPLASHGCTIVSGMALGVDAAAHRATLDQGGRTIAVLGSGVDERSIYPVAHQGLAREIVAKGGCVCSEYPPLTKARTFFFPARNRIISGLSLGTLVVEAPVKSGSLITATSALEQNREVFAVPGSIFQENTEGPHSLLRKGARVVTSAADILDALNLSYEQGVKEAVKGALGEELTKEERLILEVLATDALHIDEIAARCSLDSSRLNSTLIIMEIKGLVLQTGVMKFAKGR